MLEYSIERTGRPQIKQSPISFSNFYAIPLALGEADRMVKLSWPGWRISGYTRIGFGIISADSSGPK
jgi:hypothetical protein